jgi:hypothetical protein
LARDAADSLAKWEPTLDPTKPAARLRLVSCARLMMLTPFTRSS